MKQYIFMLVSAMLYTSLIQALPNPLILILFQRNERTSLKNNRPSEETTEQEDDKRTEEPEVLVATLNAPH